MKPLNKKSFLSIVILLTSLINSGCADRAVERRSTEAYLFPVTYSLSLKIQAEHEASAEKTQQQFLQTHKTSLLTKNIELLWNSDIGQSWALKTQQQLLKLGVNRESLSVNQSKSTDAEYFDYQINIGSYQVDFADCDRFSSGRYSKEGDGCFAEQARWKSMVNPEKMLLPPLNQVQQ